MLFGAPKVLSLDQKIPNVPTERSLLRYGTKCNQGTEEKKLTIRRH